MHRRITVFALLAAVSVSACSTDVAVAPKTAPKSLSLAVSAEAAGNYIVLMNGNGISRNFKENVASLGGKVVWSHAGAGIATVSGLTNEAAAELASTSGVAEVQPDIQITLDTPLAAAQADASDIADPSISSVTNPAGAARYSWQWNMRAIGANSAWTAGKLGSAGVTVAILDSGLDYNIPDLNGLVDLTRSTSFVPADNAIRSTFFPSRNDITDFNGHGTNVATQVSSKAVALAGVTSKTTLIGVKVLGWNGSGSSSGVLNGILWAADHGANIANMSLGGGFNKPGYGSFVALINRVFNYAKQKGMLIVVAAGNAQPPAYIPVDLQHNGNQYITYCDAPHVICVAAVGPITYSATSVPQFNGDVPAWYSYYGRSAISVAAPGGNYNPVTPTVSVWPWGPDIASWVWSYCAKDRIASLTTAGVPVLTVCAAGNRLSGYIGTSQAAPHVAGLAASLMAELGTGQPQLIKNIIEQSSVPIDPAYGRGRISVSNALGL
ncbi:MAG: S8 family serine peptidase [Gemmatimonadota bacterium]|nr:S8 family serine peptidase [Gemmatimonadota bacterium]